jgi:hypothetical protein
MIERLRIEASEELCRQLRPQYDEVAEEFADALLALGKAICAHEKFVKEHLIPAAIRDDSWGIPMSGEL